MNTAEILREFKRKYDGTFFFTKPSKEAAETLIQCQSIDIGRDGSTATMHAVGYGVGTLSYKIPSEQTFVFKMPPIGVFQVGSSAMHVLRSPRRQWQRGICDGNTSVTNVASNILTSFRSQLDLDTVHAIFQKQVFSYREALSMLESKKYLSVAIGEGFSVCQTPEVGSDGYLMLHNRDVIATISSAGLVRKLYQSVYVKKVNQLVSK